MQNFFLLSDDKSDLNVDKTFVCQNYSQSTNTGGSAEAYVNQQNNSVTAHSYVTFLLDFTRKIHKKVKRQEIRQSPFCHRNYRSRTPPAGMYIVP